MWQLESTVSNLANDICGECVPREYAPELKESMGSDPRAGPQSGVNYFSSCNGAVWEV